MDDPAPDNFISLAVTSASALADGDGELVSILLKLLLLFALIFVNAFFAMSEIAIISLNDTKIERLAEEGDKKAKQIMRLTENSSNFLSMIQIGVTLAGFLTSAAAADSFAPILTDAVAPLMPGIPVGIIDTVSLVLITIVISYFSLVLGELVPKKIGMQKAEKISYKIVGFLLVFMKITKPVVKVLAFSTNTIVRLFGIDPSADEEKVTEEEILMMVDVGEESGVIENAQAEMISNIFELDDIDAGDIMTHRVDMTAVEADEPVSEVIKVAIADGYSRIPVFDDDPDNIIGMVYVKDLLGYIGKEIPMDKSIREVMREAYFVPETKKCGQLFTEMSEKHIQMAIVVDEYGGTAGLVTLEDIIESIVGNIQDEYDDEDEEIAKINDTTFTVEGNTDIDEVDELVGAELPQEDYDTLAGFIISRLGYLPKDGDMDTVEYENLKFTVLSVEDKRIAKVRIDITPRDEEIDEENDEPEERRGRIRKNKEEQ
ncbi:MAG: HlyC/CorC family transporter [Clostridia bacterium]|nr:HlyC/CorC family transporter [Clostridia bacterium]